MIFRERGKLSHKPSGEHPGEDVARFHAQWRRENPTAGMGNRPKGFVIEKIVADCMSYSEKNYAELFTVTLEGQSGHVLASRS